MSEHNTDRREGMVRYRIAPRVNPIQARLAWEDYEGWTPGFLLACEGDTVTVVLTEDADIDGNGPVKGETPASEEDEPFARGGFDLAETSIEGLPVGGVVWVTERWNILAFPDVNGNATALRPAAGMAGTVFALAGFGRLRFLLTQLIDEPIEQQEVLDELVYGTVTDLAGDNCFFINRRVDVEYAAEVEEVVASCSTWGEVRELASLELYDDLLGRCGYGTVDDYLQHLKIGRPIRGAYEMGAETFDGLGHSGLPDDDEPFDELNISGYQDGDFPPAPDYLQDQLLPSDLADEYGHKMETIFNGTYLELPPESAQPIVAAMEELGYTCVENPGLFIAGFRF